MSDTERIAKLEDQVKVLTEALQSTLDWKPVPRGRQHQSPAHQVGIGGQDRTREILGRLED